MSLRSFSSGKEIGLTYGRTMIESITKYYNVMQSEYMSERKFYKIILYLPILIDLITLNLGFKI